MKNIMNNLIIILILFSTFYLSGSLNNNNLLLIISFDGFRYDYYTRNLSNTLVGLRNNSSYAPYMLSVFPSKTFPNHFSIATGLYAEVHGVLDNKVYDKSFNKSLGYGYELFHYNSEIVPLWTLNERGGGGRGSGCMMWPGSEFTYQNTTLSHYKAWDKNVPWPEKVDILLSWFNDHLKPINLGMIYFAEPDLACHKSGPDSKAVNDKIKELNDVLTYLLEKAGGELLKRLNIVILSDHGGQSVKVPENIITLEKFVNASWIKKDGVPPNLQIYPIEGKEKEVLKSLKDARLKSGGNFSTYTKEEMLDRWHYKHCNRTPPILVSADVGFLFYDNKSYQETDGYIGTHGYDPLETNMHAFFLAYGPQFKRNFTVPPFENINIYPMAAELLGLTLPLVKPNGTLSPLKSILINYHPDGTGKLPNKLLMNQDDSYRTKYFVAGFVVSFLCLVILIAYFFKRTKWRREININTTASYRALNQRPEVEKLIEMPDEWSSSDEAELPT